MFYVVVCCQARSAAASSSVSQPLQTTNIFSAPAVNPFAHLEYDTDKDDFFSLGMQMESNIAHSMWWGHLMDSSACVYIDASVFPLGPSCLPPIFFFDSFTRPMGSTWMTSSSGFSHAPLITFASEEFAIIVDSGATSHMFSNTTHFLSYNFTPGGYVILANKQSVEC